MSFTFSSTKPFNWIIDLVLVDKHQGEINLLTPSVSSPVWLMVYYLFPIDLAGQTIDKAVSS